MPRLLDEAGGGGKFSPTTMGWPQVELASVSAQ